ncbi:MAG: hypothetical protein BWY64_03230 [bacterium ADurb.Bin363]|nr:MAG: hypothetical protein BWY64_03230 [bacterium ADurb.Bin363]
MPDIFKDERDIEIRELKEEIDELRFENGFLKKKLTELQFCIDISPRFEKMVILKEVEVDDVRVERLRKDAETLNKRISRAELLLDLLGEIEEEGVKLCK